MDRQSGKHSRIASIALTAWLFAGCAGKAEVSRGKNAVTDAGSDAASSSSCTKDSDCGADCIDCESTQACVSSHCNSAGECAVYSRPTCPCTDKPCGAQCDLCGGTTAYCLEGHCDAQGACDTSLTPPSCPSR